MLKGRTLLFAIGALVAISPLGNEGTHPAVFLTYRLLLLAITIGSLIQLRSKAQPEICPIFVTCCAIVPLLMLLSIEWNPGSRFDGFYRWYQFVLFGLAFLTVAVLNRTKGATWNRAILQSVIAIDIIYLLLNLAMGERPIVFPFINPNYFASFLLVGFAASIAFAVLEDGRITRITAIASAVFLFYGMTQTWSRGATMAAAGMTILALIRVGMSRRISRATIAIIVIVLIIAGTLASPVLIRKFLDRGTIDPYNYQRPKIWLGALRVIGEHPVLGVGLGQFFHVSKRFSPAVEGTIGRYLKRPGIAHSEYLQFVAESGIPAALLLFSLAGYLVFVALQRARTCTPEQSIFYEAAILTAAGLGAHALVDNNWDVPVMAAGLMVFATADVLPRRRWFFSIDWTPRLRTVCAMAVLFVLADGVFIPGLALYLNEEGHQAFTAGNLERAESLHRLAAAVVPGHDVFLDNVGAVYLEMYSKTHDGRWPALEKKFFTEASRVNPNSEDALRHLELALIQGLTGNERKDQATHRSIIETEARLLEIVPFFPFARMNLAEALYRTGRIDEAQRELVQAIQYEPNYVPAYLRLAEWLSKTGNLAGSDDYRHRAISIVTRFQNVEVKEPYESLLLGRPQARPDISRTIHEQ